MVLRDPADRLFSHYKAVRAMGRTSLAFAEWAEAEQRIEEQRDVRWGSVWAGRYASHLARYLDHFPRERLHIVIYDDFASTPAKTLRQLFAALGVDPGAAIDTAERFNVTAVPRWQRLNRPPARRAWRGLKRVLPRGVLSRLRDAANGASLVPYGSGDRARIIAMHEEDIRAVEQWIGRTLPRWHNAGAISTSG
jgi:hypothetical protein